MALLNEEVREQVTEALSGLESAVRLVGFTKPEDCPYCSIIVELMEEVASCSDQVSVEIYDFTQDAAQVAEFNIDKAPAIAIVGAEDYGLRFFGVPAQHEFGTLIHGIQAVGHGHAHLDDETLSYLSTLDQEVNLRVFVTPGCPHCPGAATLAFDMALASPHVYAEIVEAGEFQELSNQFNVMGVPLSVVNERERVEGRAPADMIVDAIEAALTA